MLLLALRVAYGDDLCERCQDAGSRLAVAPRR
jgi:hypothetical protein